MSLPAARCVQAGAGRVRARAGCVRAGACWQGSVRSGGKSRAVVAQAVPDLRDGGRGDPRQAPAAPGSACPQWRRRSGGDRGAGHRPPARTDAGAEGSDHQTAAAREVAGEAVAAHSGRRAARSLAARRRAVCACRRQGPALLGHPVPRVSPPEQLGEGRGTPPGRGRAPVSRPQPVPGGARLRRELHVEEKARWLVAGVRGAEPVQAAAFRARLRRCAARRP